jgi:predicted RNA binding protein YcfA (HicA-like mRNA interferase family)
MPSLPRVWRREVIRALEKLGFVVRRQRGSHVILRRGAKLAGVSRDDFLAAVGS